MGFLHEISHEEKSGVSFCQRILTLHSSQKKGVE